MSEGDLLWGLENESEALEQFDRFPKYFPRRSRIIRPNCPALVLARFHPYEVYEFPDLGVHIERGAFDRKMANPARLGFADTDNARDLGEGDRRILADKREDEQFALTGIERSGIKCLIMNPLEEGV